MTSPAASADPSEEASGVPSDAARTLRFTFGKIEKLCSKRSFDILFQERRAFYVGCLQIIYTTQHPAELATAPMMVAITVPKRNFKRAVDRNLLKRRIREAYRLQKHALIDSLKAKEKNAACLIKYNVREIRSFNDIAQDMQRALDRLMKFI